MRILIHDYAGHPFQVQLSRKLAERGYEILHIYSLSVLTPRGRLKKIKNDPKNLNIKGIALSKVIAKYSYLKRYFQEKKYAKLLIKEIKKFDPDIIISSNTPIVIQEVLLNFSKKSNIKFIFWLQDIYGIGIEKVLTKKIPLFGKVMAKYFINLERNLLENSDKIILITEDFQSILKSWGVNTDKCIVIHNWAPLEEIPVYLKDNPWARDHYLHDKFCFMYSGTLGIKHNPELLLKLAEAFKENKRIKVVVISEGLGAEWLKEKKKEKSLDNLFIMKFQPFEVLPQVLASADVLVAILEADAGIFSVPSKVLTYHCVGRPLLLAVPQENLAAKIIRKYNTGITVDPRDIHAFVNAARRLLENKTLRSKLGINARKYAEEHFNIEKITDKFEWIIKDVLKTS
ncbi:glycosyltransferase family 4 protein [Thermodesulfatator atlanticus]|uniref:glycosyltransferase family 4 protein n=1 Tax=Thermodesulfatator atlanticus TaxID=501497 RepID=UPI0003B43D0A|nr:glycosyltransferase family 4 protein [Thermodesulfatator atlanticus]